MLGRLKKLCTGSGVIMMSRLAGAGVGFLTQFMLVKLMGAHDLGLFYAGSSLAIVLGLFAAQGYPQIAARFAARYRNKNSDGLFATFTGHALRESLIAAALMALAVIVWAQVWPGLGSDERIVYAIGGLLTVAVAALNNLTNIAGGMRRFVLCYVPEGLLRPLVFIVFVAIAGLTGIQLGAVSALGVFALITTAIAVMVAVLLSRRMPSINWRPVSRSTMAWRWRSEAWQLIALAIFTNYFADVGILAVVPYLSKSDVAVFGLCLKLALLVGYFVQIAQQMAVPDMADARHSGDDQRLRRAAWRSIALPSAITLASCAVIYLIGDWLLAFFGPRFAEGQPVLLILLATQLIRALAGPGVHLLTLRGNQRINMMIAGSAFVLLFAASAVLTPAFGIEGAAGAVLAAYAFWIAASAIALRRLGEASVDIVWLALDLWRSTTAKPPADPLAMPRS